MHKYSYELSDYYRKQPSHSCHYHTSQSKYNKNIPYPESVRNKDKRSDVRAQFSKTMMVNNSNYPIFERQKKSNNDLKSKKLHLYKPSNTIANLQSRLANLTNLSDRHNQALQQINKQPKREDFRLYVPQKPSLKANNYINQSNTLKHQFSFNQIPQYEKQNLIIAPLKTQYNPYLQRPSNSKPSQYSKVPYEVSKQRLNTRQKAQLHLSMAHLNHPNTKQSNIRKENNKKEQLRINKGQSQQTYNKLSSLQERIKSTIQPYANF